ncbi:MAG: hypothetical protein HY319_25290 [Armatimonadetes bacterium]|nr:hypothetical protein [Armatimonadota bacterium]
MSETVEQPEVDPKSPLGVARALVEDYAEERVEQQQFLEALDRYDAQIQLWAEENEKVTLPPDYEEGPAMLEAVFQGLQQLADGVALLRQFGEQGDFDLAEQGLAQIEEGQQLLAHLENMSAEKLEEMQEFSW